MEDKPSIEQISHLFRLIGDGSCTRTNLQAYLEKPNGLIVCAEITSFPIWKTIKLGTGLKSTKDFSQALTECGCRVSDWAADILGKPAFSVANQAVEVDLVKVTVAELGFPNGATVRDIYEAALKRGLVRCPNEVGPQLRRQYLDQPMGEWILVGMEPISDSVGYLEVFHVMHDVDGRWLFGDFGHPDGVWSGDSSWVFIRPRK